MSPSVDVTGGEQLTLIAKRLKAAGAGQLRRELLAAIRVAMEPAKKAEPDSARSLLPKAGGLNELVASSKFGVRTRLAGKVGSVSLRALNPHAIGAMNRGRLRHPVFGNRNVWVTQQITPGWFYDPVIQRLPTIKADVQFAANIIARRIERGV